MKKYFVYILRCVDGTYYTGVTNDLERRFAEHQSGLHPSSYTFERRPLELVYVSRFDDIRDAIDFETMVKKWGKAKKEALINGDTFALKLASRKNFPKRYARVCQRKIRAVRFLVRFCFAKATRNDRAWVITAPRYGR